MDPKHTSIEIDEIKKISKVCIFKVPKVLRRQKPEAYTPDVASIGPFHRLGRNKEAMEDTGEEFQLIEQAKKRYSDEILLSSGNLTLKQFIKKVKEHSDQRMEGSSIVSFETRAREFYGEPLDHISSQDFVEMMIIDGCFLLQLFRKCNHMERRAFDDPVFSRDCMLHFLCHDILLLENQLPWFVLESLYFLTHEKYPPEPSLAILVLKAFIKLPLLKHTCKSYCPDLEKENVHGDSKILHLLDLVRNWIVYPKLEREDCSKEDAIFDPEVHQMHTATALSKAGITFKNSDQSKSIMEIEFEEARSFFKNGVVIIPQLHVGMLSESLFRNLIAMEQCYPGYANEITSYAMFIDNLISSNEDMELLCKAKVIGNWLSDEEGCKFFNNLYSAIPHNEFYYADLCKRVNERYKIRRHTWVASFKTEKFSNPWTVAAFFIGLIVLFLSLWNSSYNFHKSLKTF